MSKKDKKLKNLMNKYAFLGKLDSAQDDEIDPFVDFVGNPRGRNELVDKFFDEDYDLRIDKDDVIPHPPINTLNQHREMPRRDIRKQTNPNFRSIAKANKWGRLQSLDEIFDDCVMNTAMEVGVDPIEDLYRDIEKEKVKISDSLKRIGQMQSIIKNITDNVR